MQNIRDMQKNMSCLIKKASRCVADHMSKTTTFSIKHKDLLRKSCENYMFLFSLHKEQQT